MENPMADAALPRPITRMPALPGFDIPATLLAHPFRIFDGPECGRQTATFFEHAAIVGGIAIAALFVHGRSALR